MGGKGVFIVFPRTELYPLLHFPLSRRFFFSADGRARRNGPGSGVCSELSGEACGSLIDSSMPESVKGGGV